MPDAAELLSQANAARDTRQWSAAAALYGEYLALRPDDRGVIVQRGHMVKEAGDPAAALALYAEAEALDDTEADIHLQMGHALKLLGREAEALARYARASAIEPAAADTWVEWHALAHRSTPAVRRVTGVALDLSDLAVWILGDRRAPSGIQRVQYEVAAGLLADESVVFCAMLPAGAEGVGGGWREWPKPLLERLRRLSASGSDASEEIWQEAAVLLRDWLARAPDLVLAPGALILCPGTAWVLPQYSARLLAARAAGVRHVPLLHDAMPLAVPEWCNASTVEQYARWFSALPILADAILCNSEATAADLRRFAGRYLPELPLPPVAVVPLNGIPAAPELPGEVPAALRERSYVLCVGTIEGRKNHALIFQAWLNILRQLGPACPVLVCVGRPGWRAEGAMALLDASPELKARVMILHDVDDATLRALTENCRFAVCASHAEGWGLPVSEALALGRPVLAAAHSALLESGAGGAVFFAPNSEPDFVAKALSLIADPAPAAAAIKAKGGCRPWGAVAASMLEAARSLLREAGAAAMPELPPGLRVRLSPPPGRRPSLEAGLAGTLPRGEGWGAATPLGRLFSGTATLGLRAPDEALRVVLEITPVAGAADLRLTAWRDGAEDTVTLRVPPEGAEAALELPAGGEVLELELEGETPVALRSVGLARVGQAEDRLRLLEAQELVFATQR
ncbi:glycosyltransferase family 4 protein [Roseomonas elaeocarpi]|uniref:Glycosyltransferase n=1 Tax=Roseomonas elaeocarpi TaxID=907779 RepID=A0ABV6JRH7_9PROT